MKYNKKDNNSQKKGVPKGRSNDKRGHDKKRITQRKRKDN
jgi:hypothetical protein